MKWRVVIVGSLALESVKEIADEFVQVLKGRGAKIDQAEFLVPDKMEESMNLLVVRDEAASVFVSQAAGGSGYDKPAEIPEPAVTAPTGEAEADAPPPEPEPKLIEEPIPGTAGVLSTPAGAPEVIEPTEENTAPDAPSVS